MDIPPEVTQRVPSGPQSAPIPTALKTAPRLDVPVAREGQIDPVVGCQLSRVHGEFAAFHQGYAGQYILLADTKAGLTFSFDSALIAWLVGNPENKALILHPAGFLPSLTVCTALVLLLFSACCAFFVVVPRLSSRSGEGIIFFGAVARRKSSSDFIHDIALKNETDLITARLGHSYDLSKICQRKYRHLKLAMWAAFLGLLATAASMLTP